MGSEAQRPQKWKKKETDIFYTIVFIVFVILTINSNF